MLRSPKGCGPCLSKPQPRDRRERNFPFGWAFLAAILLGFLGMLWVRSQIGSKPTPLEALIAANAPNESVQALAAQSDGTLLVATNASLIQGQGSKWRSIPAFDGKNVTAVAVDRQGAILAAGPEIGLVRYQNGQLQTVRPDGVRTMALHPTDDARILVLLTSGKLLQTINGGQDWTQVVDFGDNQVLSLAIRPGQAEQINAGDVQGTLHFASSGVWGATAPRAGSITALQFDAAGQLWLLAGGKAYYESGVEFHAASVKGEKRPLVGLAVVPSTQNGVWAVSADGLLLSLSK